MPANYKKRLWIFDFDGTLAPLMSDRNEAILHPLCEKLLHDLVDLPFQYVAVLSSRMLDDLIPRVGVPELWLGGASGIEWMAPDGKRLTFAGTLEEDLDQARRELLPYIKELKNIPGIEIEDKKWSLAIHTRKASPEARKSLLLCLDKWNSAYLNRLFKGPEVFELQFLPGINKAFGLRVLCDYLGFEPGQWDLIYAGDDENDAVAIQEVFSSRGTAFTVGGRLVLQGAISVNNQVELVREFRRLIDSRI
ncbi:MAG: trehalose-phosphatase [Candidatus Tectomicrobia bacterium]|uniref:Trehalose 6-phosphate phosphatase n=1 Tax=Tectimicrobiota bacterium TaxID=2528274 RepID=A0A933LPR8_UNCTE|nr:trehalose-phosphatase [Candidatus Tectomicrobia bacterium]